MLQEVELWNPKKEKDKEEKTIQKDQVDKELDEISEKASEVQRNETAR